MPTWTDPITVVDGQVLTAALWNLEIRDKLRALGLSTIQEGQIIQGDGAKFVSGLWTGGGLAAQPRAPSWNIQARRLPLVTWNATGRWSAGLLMPDLYAVHWYDFR